MDMDIDPTAAGDKSIGEESVESAESIVSDKEDKATGPPTDEKNEPNQARFNLESSLQAARDIFGVLTSNQEGATDTANPQLALLSSLQQKAALLTALQTHNLIPSHLQSTNTSEILAALNGTPGHPPAVIQQSAESTAAQQLQAAQQLTELAAAAEKLNSSTSSSSSTSTPSSGAAVDSIPSIDFIYTVQGYPMNQPVYNGVNPAYPGLRVVHTAPPIFCVDDFLTDYECDFLISHASDSFGPAPVVGKGAGEVSPSRTSSTCYLAREDLPDLLRKVSTLTGKPVDHCELPQVGRYFPSQQYLQHYDAFDIGTDDGRRFAAHGGQRTVTVLIYLNTVERGGATRFPAINLNVQPKKGMALVFFPATVNGLLDKMALHAALPAIDTKFVSQVWIRQSTYAGQPSKRLPQTLGVPFGQQQQVAAGTLAAFPQQQPQPFQPVNGVLPQPLPLQQINVPPPPQPLLNLGQPQQQQQQQVQQQLHVQQPLLNVNMGQQPLNLLGQQQPQQQNVPPPQPLLNLNLGEHQQPQASRQTMPAAMTHF